MSTVVSIMDRRSQIIARLAKRAGLGETRDEAAFVALRQAVAGELLNQDSMAVIVQAAELVEGRPEGDALRDAVHHSNQFFYMGDRTLAAVAVPLVIKAQTPARQSVTIWNGTENGQRAMEMVVKNTTGARSVHFDPCLYRTKDLVGARARDIRDHMLALERGEAGKRHFATPAQVVSKQAPEWELVFFLGVAVYEQGDEMRLNEPEVVKQTRALARLAENAVLRNDPVSWAQELEVEARCFGFYYLYNALQRGEDNFRGHQLDSFIGNFDADPQYLDFSYSLDVDRRRVRLLVQSNKRAAEFVWNTWGGEEGTLAFRQVLDHIIADKVGDVRDVIELRLQAYEDRSKRAGVAS
jgi:hypothetical protein